VHLTALAAAPDGSTVLRVTECGTRTEAESVGRKAAARLRADGALDLLQAAAALATPDPRAVPAHVRHQPEGLR
jgi:porphobilinogen deaminase